MSKQLQIAADLALPADAATSTLVVYGGKGMGKTNLGAVLVEELAAARIRFSVLDPVGVWWGLQHGADKGTPGLEVLLLGGPRGDIPILPTAGAVVADLVVDETVSVVIDIARHASGTMWSTGEQIRFVADYVTRLYERQGETRRPLHQVIDEAGRLVPQVIPSGAVDLARCVGAIERLVELGRNVGVGVTLITQRSARMNKSVSELADCMLAFRTVGPRSIDAVVDWFGEHVPKDRWRGLVEQLRSLERGEALVVSPGWLEYEGLAHIRARRTFDSSATPTPGHALRAPGKATKPDLGQYRARMEATIAEAEASNPKALRRRVADLERELAAAKASTPTATPAEPIEVPILRPAEVKRLEDALGTLGKLGDRLEAQLGTARGIGAELADKLGRAVRPPAPPVARPTSVARGIVNRAIGDALNGRPVRFPVAGSADGGELRTMHRAMLTALAQHPAGLSKGLVRLHTGYADSGPVSRAFAELAARGYVAQGGAGLLITPAGLDALGPFEPLPTGDALREHLLTGNKLSVMERTLLSMACADGPVAMTKGAVRTAAGYADSGPVSRAFGRLVKYGYLTPAGAGQVRASDVLFG